MTDFLMRLAERTLNTFPLVQPRIASVYDPLPVIPSSATVDLFQNRPDAENAEKITRRSNLDTNGFDPGRDLLELQGEKEKESGLAIEEMLELNQSANTDFSGAKNQSFRGFVSNTSVPEKQISSGVEGEFDRLVASTIAFTPEVVKSDSVGFSPSLSAIEETIAFTPEAVKSDSVGFSPSLSAFASAIPTSESNPILSESKTVNLKVSQEIFEPVLDERETKVDRANQHLTAKETPEKYSSVPLSGLASPSPLRSEIFPKNSEIPSDRALVASPSSLEAKIQPASRPVPPTVRVNIGRIEVRAIPAPAKPPKESRSPPTPKLSLAEYLRSQGGQP